MFLYSTCAVWWADVENKTVTARDAAYTSREQTLAATLLADELPGTGTVTRGIILAAARALPALLPLFCWRRAMPSRLLLYGRKTGNAVAGAETTCLRGCVVSLYKRGWCRLCRFSPHYFSMTREEPGSAALLGGRRGWRAGALPGSGKTFCACASRDIFFFTLHPHL